MTVPPSSRFVEGQDPRNIELMWDQMWRATINYGRKGLPIQAISAVDLALWDLLGKLRGESTRGFCRYYQPPSTVAHSNFLWVAERAGHNGGAVPS
jgi:hypothetical protein